VRGSRFTSLSLLLSPRKRTLQSDRRALPPPPSSLLPLFPPFRPPRAGKRYRTSHARAPLSLLFSSRIKIIEGVPSYFFSFSLFFSPFPPADRAARKRCPCPVFTRFHFSFSSLRNIETSRVIGHRPLFPFFLSPPFSLFFPPPSLPAASISGVGGKEEGGVGVPFSHKVGRFLR